MPKKPLKTKKTPAKAVRKMVSPVELAESFVRDLSFECLLAPSLQPSKEREMEFTLSRAVRKEAGNRMCVNIAMQVRISPKGNAPFTVAEMIYENVYNVTGENKVAEAWVNLEGSQETYAKARENMLGVLARSGLNPPIPATVDFSKVVHAGNAK